MWVLLCADSDEHVISSMPIHFYDVADFYQSEQ
jgi:hypothetical protein